MEIKKEVKYIGKYALFTTNTFWVLNALWGIGFTSKILKFNEKKKTKVFKNILHQFGNGGLIKVKTKVYFEDETIKNDDFPNALFLANHRSMADVLALFATAPKSMRFVAKSSLFKIPYFGQTMRYIGIFEIDRKNKEKAIKTLDLAVERLKTGLNSVVMFPEGSRSRNRSMLPFKKGAFYLAIQSQAPIIPVTIKNSENILPVGSWRMKDGIIEVYYSKPIETKGLTTDDIPELMEKVKKAIEKNL